MIVGARWSLALLLAINLFNYIDRYVLAGVEERIQSDFGSSDALMGLLPLAFMISYMCLAPLFGWLSDRYHRWSLIGIGVILWSLASGATGLATSISAMLLTRIFVGVGEAAYGPVAPTLIADLFPIQRRGTVLAWFYAAIPVGSALGYLLAAAVLKLLHLSWHWSFFIVVPPGILLGVLAVFMRDPRRGAAEKRRPATLADYKQLLRIPSYLIDTAGMTTMAFAMGGIAFWIPKYLVWRAIYAGTIDPGNDEMRRSALADANWVFGLIVVVSGLLGTLAGGWLGDRLRARWSGSYFLVSGGSLLVAFPLVLLVPAVDFPQAWTLIFVAVFCLFFSTGPTNTILVNVTPPGIRAAAFAVNIFLIHALGDAFSPFVIGWVNEAFSNTIEIHPGIKEAGAAGRMFLGNMNVGFYLMSAMVLISGLLWLWGARYLERDTARVLESESALDSG
jgi:MFS transporter, Spinster family, sphingosine-1-phosphate transporter